MILDLILRWMHILSAVVLVGGTIFQWAVLSPALSGGKADEIAAAARARWSKLVMAASGLLLISGIINLVLILQRYEILREGAGSLYHAMFGIKFLLAFAVFFLSSALAGRSGMAVRLRERERVWLTVNMVLAISVVCLGGFMKLAPRSPKSAALRQPRPPAAVALPGAATQDRVLSCIEPLAPRDRGVNL